MKEIKIELSIEESAAVCAALNVACSQCKDTKVFEKTLDSFLKQVLPQLN